MRLLLALPFVLVACGLQPIVTVPKDVLIEGTQRPCKAVAIAKPLWDTDKVASTYLAKIKAMGSELNQRAGYEIEVEAALAGCMQLKLDTTMTPTPTTSPTFTERIKSIFKRGNS